MNIILTILYWYILLGVVFFPVLMLMELAVHRIRGPEYTRRISSEMRDDEDGGGTSTARMMLGWLTVWPVVLATWIYAGWHSMSLFEHYATRRAKKREFHREIKKTIQQNASRLPQFGAERQGRLWMVSPVPGLPFMPYLRIECHGMDFVVTHMVYLNGLTSECHVHRVGVEMDGDPPDFEDNTILLSTTNFDEAIQWCENDTRWSELCRTGTAKQRELLQRVGA